MVRRETKLKTPKRHRWKCKAYGRRVLSFLLCTAMALQAGAGVSFVSAAETPSYTMLEASRIEELPEGDFIYFGTASASVEERGEYAIRIYREGDLSKEASVSLRTIDMTALYGKDYELVSDTVEELEETGSKKTLLEEYAKGQKFDGTDKTDSSFSEEDVSGVPVMFGEAGAVEEDGAASESAAKTSSLAAAKEEQTKEKTRALEETEGKAIADLLSEVMVTTSMESLKYSSAGKINFQKGESEKIVRFRILEDEESEGTEGFTLLLAEPEGVELYEVSTAGITIEDDEKQVHSEISFTKPEYQAENGTVTLTVKRTGAEYSVCDMTVLTSGDTAKAGENYEERNETLSFAPYEVEKEITIDVTGEGTFCVLLTELKACEEGKYTKASVRIKAESQKKAYGKVNVKNSGKASEEKKPAAGSSLKKADKSDDKTKSFSIKIDKKNYTVEYTMGEATGKILDESYAPAVEVGTYYFSSDKGHGGLFKYGKMGGDKPNCFGNRKSEYIYKSKDDMSANFGKLEYFSTTMWHEGYAEAEMKNAEDKTAAIPGIYYQYFAPDWKSKSDYGIDGQLFEFYMTGTGTQKSVKGKAEGKFDRTCDRGVIKNMSNEEQTATLYAKDVNALTPKSYLEFYGICSMYKKYNIKVENAAAKKYRTGEADSYIEMAPANMNVRCGAQVLSSGAGSRDVYANVSDEDTNMVFSIGDMSLNNHSGKFGYITGYTLKIDPGEKEDLVSVQYPKDFTDYLRKNTGKKDVSGIDFSSTAVEKEIKKVEQDLSIVPYDKYFISWIDSVQKAVMDNGHGYQQNLTFKPFVEYYDVKVEVLAPKDMEAGNDTVHFKDTQLSKTGAYTFHAGDSIGMEVVSEDTDTYNVVGYEVSDNNGVTYNTITDGSDLFLEYDKSYKVRPVVTEKSNAIEIRLNQDSKAEEIVEIQGLIRQEDLKGTEFEGKNILDLNPQEKTVLKRAEPVKGKEYVVRLILKKEGDGDYVYRPSVKLKTQNNTYIAQYFPMVAAGSVADNVVEVGISKVKKSQLKKFQIKGTVMSAIAPIRSTGTEIKKLPVPGYVVSAGLGTQYTDSAGKVQIGSASSTTGDLGEYYLGGITGVPGDRIPLLLSNGMVNGEVVDAVLSAGVKADDGESYEVNQANIEISYPYGAPRVTSLDYTYDNSTNLQKQGGNTENSVHIYDDTFTLTAKVNPYGRKIKKAIFTVYRFSDGNGSYSSLDEYSVDEEPKNPNTFKCVIPKMAENMHNGDQIKIRLVDSMEQQLEVGQYDENGNLIVDEEGNPVAGQSMAIEYPAVDTGLRFYIENELQAPQTYDLEDSPTANVPLIGNTVGSASSGLLSFEKVNWEDNTGYSLQIGVSAAASTIKSPSTDQKEAALKDYVSRVKEVTAYKDTVKSLPNAEDVILQTAGQEGKETDLAKEKKSIQGVLDKIKSDAKSGAKNAIAGLNKAATMSISAAFLLDFDFVFDQERQEYIFCSGAVTIGGTYTFNKTHYALIEFVPAFLNITATLQANVLVSYATEEGKAALTAGDFNNYSGNLAKKLSGSTAKLSVLLSGKMQVGTGLCGVLSARGYVSVALQFDIPIDGRSMEDNYGVLVKGSGGVGFDVLVISINVNVANGTYGWGTLANQTGFGFFGGLINSDKKMSKKMKSAAPSSNGDIVLKENGKKEQIVLHSYTAGTSDMDSFGKGSALKKASPSLTSVTPLLDNAAEHTRPKIIPLGQDKKMIVFIANREGDSDKNFVLNYSIYNGSEWSKPEPVAEDGTIDSTPAVLKAGNKVIIAWSDASRTFTEKDSTIDRLTAMGISAAVYDIPSGRMGKEVTLAEDNYMNLSPQLNIDGTKIYCSYMKRDVAGAKEEELLDMKKIYSAMAYRSYDYVSGETKEESFVSVKHKTITDPLLMDYNSVITEVGKDSYLVSTYTVDEDTDFNTNEDRELFLSIYNLTKGREYYPIQISDDSISQSSPRLTDINGTVYLTWLDSGYLFNLTDVSSLLEAFFEEGTKSDSDIAVDKSCYINSYIDGEKENKDWYSKTAKELGMDSEAYENSVYQDIASGNFGQESVNFSQNEDITSNISSYILTTDGDDMYIFFTDFGTEEDSTGLEIYGMKYKRMLKEKAEDSSEGDEEWGFSGKAVQITQENKVIDELDLYMAEDGTVSAVSNYFSQWIDESGSIQYGSNQLVEMEFGLKNSLEVQDDDIILPLWLAGGQTENLSFVVENNGLMDAKGFDYKVSCIKGGTETEIESGHKDIVLESGGVTEVLVPWKMPDSLADTKIKVELTETGIAGSKPYIVTKNVPYESNVKFTNAKVRWDKDVPYVAVTVSNAGNISSKEYDGKLSLLDAEGKEKKTYEEFKVPSLQPGEEKSIEISFTPKVSDFSSLGILDLKLSAGEGETAFQTYTRLSSSVPVCAVVNDGKAIKLKAGSKTKVEAKAAPWNGIAGTAVFYSDNPEVAAVDSQGNVTGIGAGKTTIHAYYPSVGVSASVSAEVTGSTGKTETGKITPKQTSVVIAAGKSKTVSFKTTVKNASEKTAAVKASVSDKKVVSKALVSGSKVKITVAKKAVKGASATVTLKAVNASGKMVSAKIKVTVQNQTKKITPSKKKLTVKKGKTAKLSLKVSAQNNKKPVTDTVKVKASKVALTGCTVKKGKLVLKLKGKKKGTENVVVQLGKKKAKVKVTVK